MECACHRVAVGHGTRIPFHQGRLTSLGSHPFCSFSLERKPAARRHDPHPWDSLFCSVHGSTRGSPASSSSLFGLCSVAPLAWSEEEHLRPTCFMFHHVSMSGGLGWQSLTTSASEEKSWRGSRNHARHKIWTTPHSRKLGIRRIQQFSVSFGVFQVLTVCNTSFWMLKSWLLRFGSSFWLFRSDRTVLGAASNARWDGHGGTGSADLLDGSVAGSAVVTGELLGG